MINQYNRLLSPLHWDLVGIGKIFRIRGLQYKFTLENLVGLHGTYVDVDGQPPLREGRTPQLL